MSGPASQLPPSPPAPGASADAVEWRAPPRVVSAARRKQRREFRFAGLRWTLLAVACVGAFHLWVIRRGLPLAPAQLAMAWAVCVGGSIALWVWALLGSDGAGRGYCVTAKGILRPNHQGGLLLWKYIAAADIERSRLVADANDLVLYLTSGVSMRLPLPDGELADRVLAAVAAQVPTARERPEVLEASEAFIDPPRRLCWAMGLASIVVGIILGWWVAQYPLGPGPKPALGFLLMLPLFVGPAPFTALAVYRRKLFHVSHTRVWLWAYVFNMVSWLAAVLTWLALVV